MRLTPMTEKEKDAQRAHPSQAVSPALADRMKVEASEREGARYKIDLLLGSKFSLRRPSHGMISFWESGRALNGDGDTKLYLCPGKTRNGDTDCGSFIHGHALGHTSAVCVECGAHWKSESLVGEFFYRLEPPKWAEVLAKWFEKLEFQADIRIIYPPDDIRSLAMTEQEKQRGGDLLDPARSRRAIRAYPMLNILRDIGAGADLTKRMLAFVSA